MIQLVSAAFIDLATIDAKDLMELTEHEKRHRFACRALAQLLNRRAHICRRVFDRSGVHLLAQRASDDTVLALDSEEYSGAAFRLKQTGHPSWRRCYGQSRGAKLATYFQKRKID